MTTPTTGTADVSPEPGSTRRRALLTGVTGQDGSYLAELLLAKGYEVHGLKRRASSFNTKRVDHLYEDPHERDVNFRMHYGDMTDSTNLIRIVQEVQPDEIYNLAAQSHVAVSFETPEYTANADGIGTLRLLEAIRILGLEQKTKFYQASTSELYGLVRETPQSETTPFYPRSPYAAAKMYALLDHGELPRGVRHVRDQRHPVQPREPAPRRDLRDAQDHARRRPDRPRAWSPASTSATSTRSATGATPATTSRACGASSSTTRPTTGSSRRAAPRPSAASARWPSPPPASSSRGKGADENEVGRRTDTGAAVVQIDPAYYRPTEVELLLGDPSKAERELGWTATTSLEDMTAEMVACDLAEARAAGERVTG